MFKSNSVHDVEARGKRSNPVSRGFNIISNAEQDSQVVKPVKDVPADTNIFGVKNQRSPSGSSSPRRGRKNSLVDGTRPEEYTNTITLAPRKDSDGPSPKNALPHRMSKPKGLQAEIESQDDPSIDPITLQKKPDYAAQRSSKPRKKHVQQEFENDDAYSVDPITLQPREGRISVSGFPDDTTEETLRQHFAATGGLKGVNIIRDDLGFSRRMANVTTVNTKFAEKAIEQLNGTIVDGAKIRVGWTKSKNASAHH